MTFSTPVVDLRLLFLHQQIEEKIKARKRLGWQKIDELIEWLNPDTQVGGKRDSLARYDQIRTGYLMMACRACRRNKHLVGLKDVLTKPFAFGWLMPDEIKSILFATDN